MKLETLLRRDPDDPDGYFCDDCHIFEDFCEDGRFNDGDTCDNCGSGKLHAVLLVGYFDVQEALNGGA